VRNPGGLDLDGLGVGDDRRVELDDLRFAVGHRRPVEACVRQALDLGGADFRDDLGGIVGTGETQFGARIEPVDLQSDAHAHGIGGGDLQARDHAAGVERLPMQGRQGLAQAFGGGIAIDADLRGLVAVALVVVGEFVDALDRDLAEAQLRRCRISVRSHAPPGASDRGELARRFAIDALGPGLCGAGVAREAGREGQACEGNEDSRIHGGISSR